MGDVEAVDVGRTGYATDKIGQPDTLCDGSSPGTIHTTRTFSIDDSGQLTGVFHQTITPDDPADCGTFDGTYNFTGSLQGEGSTPTTIASAGQELRGTWTVTTDFVSATSAGQPVPTEGISADTRHRQDSWTFTESADGCPPGEAGCLQVVHAGAPVGGPQAVVVTRRGYKVTFTNPEESVCDGFPGTTDSTWTFAVDASGQLTGQERAVSTADDPTCPGATATWSITGSLQDEGDSTTTTSAP